MERHTLKRLHRALWEHRRKGQSLTACRRRWPCSDLKLYKKKMALMPNKFLKQGGEAKKRCV